jgi:hypothetical protein
MTPTDLFLHEEILLLALRDREGTVTSSVFYQQAIGGAVLAELLLAGRLGIETERKKKFIKLLDPTPVGEPVIDECLEKVRGARKRAQAATWVSRFAALKNLKHRVAQRLCERGILRADQDQVLLIFNRKIYPEVDPVPERELRDRLQQAIFSDADDVGPRTVVLVSLARATGLLRVLFGRKELKSRKDRIDRIVNGEVTGKATAQAVQAVQAAVIAAAIVPVMITTTVSH